jgi:hypothetical protein
VKVISVVPELPSVTEASSIDSVGSTGGGVVVVSLMARLLAVVPSGPVEAWKPNVTWPLAGTLDVGRVAQDVVVADVADDLSTPDGRDQEGRIELDGPALQRPPPPPTVMCR